MIEVSKKTAGASQGVAAVDRAIAVLEALASQAEPSTLHYIAQVTGMHKSTILRLAASLEAAGLADRLEDGSWTLGGSVFRLGLAYEKQNPLKQNVMPVLYDLVEQGTESASFHVRHGPGERICLFRVDSHHSILDRINPGMVLPLSRGAAGRVILAYSPGAGPAWTDLRNDGYAISHGERDPNCAGLAAPVFGPSGDFVGALSLSGPSERFGEDEVARMMALLLEGAARIARTLSGMSAARPSS